MARLPIESPCMLKWSMQDAFSPSLAFPVFLVIAGWVGAFVAGLLGVGGAIVLFPLLLIGPAWFDLPAMPPAQVSGAVLVQVLIAMGLSSHQHARAGRIDWPIVRPLALISAAFAWLGGLASGRAPEAWILWTFAGLTTCSAVAIAWPRASVRSMDDVLTTSSRSRSVARVVVAMIGILSGLSGLGGAVLLAPLLRWTHRLDPHRLVVTTPPIVAATAFSGLIGKVLGGPVAWDVAACLAIGTIFGAPLGARTGQRLPAPVLRLLLAGAIAASALQVGWRAWHLS